MPPSDKVSPAAAPATPDGQARHRGRRAVQRLLEYAPASGSLALWVQHQDLDDAAWAARELPDAMPAFTDGRRVFYGPGFDALPLAQQAGVLAHLVLHVALRHGPRARQLQATRGELDLPLFNRCADAIVNSTLSHLAWLELPEGALTLPQLLDEVLERHQAEEAALAQWSVEALYDAVDDRTADPEDTERPRDGPRAARLRALGGTDREDLRPDPADTDTLASEAEQAREWGERLLRGHAGDAEFSLLRALGADLPRVHTPWQHVLRRVAARTLVPQPAPNPSRPARSWLANQGRVRRSGAAPARLPFTPGTSASRAVPRVALVLDVSGSIDAPLLARLAAELRSLTRRLAAPLVLVVGDDRVREVRHHAPGLPGLDAAALRRLADAPVEGGGGTDFTPLLQEAERHRPDLTVVFTDLQGPARHRPRGRVLWAVPPAFADAQAPFGQVLVLR